MGKRVLVFSIVAASLLTFQSSYASLIGNTIDGEINFEFFGGINYFDPANGLVPGGSSGIQPQAVVSDTDASFVEFLYADNSNTITVDVDSFAIKISEIPIFAPEELNSWDIFLTGFDTPILGYSVVSSNFGNSLTISNTVDSFSFMFDGSIPNVQEGLMVELSVRTGTAVVPEPSTLLLFGAGLAGLSAVRRKK